MTGGEGLRASYPLWGSFRIFLEFWEKDITTKLFFNDLSHLFEGKLLPHHSHVIIIINFIHPVQINLTLGRCQ